MVGDVVGDVVAEFLASCGEYGLASGLYLSPWDRNYFDVVWNETCPL